jgi:hypothetical protein
VTIEVFVCGDMKLVSRQGEMTLLLLLEQTAQIYQEVFIQ